MKSIRLYLEKNKHLYWLILFIPLQAVFTYSKLTVKPTHVIFSKLDLYIPFVKEFIIPYVFWYFYVGGSVLFFGIKSKYDYYKLISLLISGEIVALTVYFLYPQCQKLQPVITQSDIFSKSIKYLYSIDAPTDVCPSLHVYNSIVVHLCIAKSLLFENSKTVKNSSLIAMILICASTVLIKQHSIVDVFWGAVLALVLYLIVEKIANNISNKAAVQDEKVNAEA
jgi:membrane-associated phospholipid phosphatase